MRRILLTLLVGCAVTALTWFMADGDRLAAVVLWPLFSTMRLFPAPCLDRGPGHEPFCDGTPVQLAAAIAGLILTAVFYAGLFLAGTLWWVRRQAAAAGGAGA